MKKIIQLFIAAVAVIFMSSFTSNTSFEFTGSYGVCKTDPSQVKLTVNADHTFYYQDFSDPGHKITATGNWTLKGKKVMLHANGTVNKFHDVWTFAENGKIAKSRKGLCFYRLVRIDE